MPERETPERAVLKTALMLLGPNGENWVQDSYEVTESGFDVRCHSDASGRIVLDETPVSFCALGAVRHARKSYRDDLPECNLLAEVLVEQTDGEYGGSPESVVEFNDTPGREFKEVKELFLEALRRCD